MNPAERILRTLDSHLGGPARIRLMGGAAMILAYGLNRSTEDVDLLEDSAEVQLLIDTANIGDALDATNRELEEAGLYLSHIWGPEQQILSPAWRSRCRPLTMTFTNLDVEALGPIDLILSKACRADDGDLADIRYLVDREQIDRQTLLDELDGAIVPSVFQEVFPANRARILDAI